MSLRKIVSMFIVNVYETFFLDCKNNKPFWFNMYVLSYVFLHLHHFHTIFYLPWIVQYNICMLIHSIVFVTNFSICFKGRNATAESFLRSVKWRTYVVRSKTKVLKYKSTNVQDTKTPTYQNTDMPKYQQTKIP